MKKVIKAKIMFWVFDENDNLITSFEKVIKFEV